MAEHSLSEENNPIISGKNMIRMTCCVSVVSHREDHMSEITRLFPNSLVKHILGAGHWVHFEKPQQFLHLVMEFLTGCK